MNRDTLNKIEDIGFKITFTLVFTATIVTILGMIVKLLILVS
jgi:hypothetical protein